MPANGDQDTVPDPVEERGVAITLWVLAVLAAEALAHWLLLPRLENSRILTVGGLAEIAIWALLFTVLVAVQRQGVPRSVHRLLTGGLAVWLVSQTADLMDEFLRQPLWLSAYGEDTARVLGMLLVALGILRLIRYNTRIVRELRRLSYRDALTGLANRRMLERRAAECGDRGYALLMLDLDRFKAVNDAHGHEAGDRVLREVAELLTGTLAGRGEAFRLGGEEFAVLLAGSGGGASVAVAEELRAAVHTYRGTSLTVSIGVGQRAADEPLGQLMRRVDRALYRAKEAGRDRVVRAD